MDYKKIEQKAREDVFNVLAYYPKDQNYRRLEKILGVAKHLKGFKITSKIEDDTSTEREKVDFLIKYVPTYNFSYEVPSINKLTDLAHEQYSQYVEKCFTISWKDDKGRPTTDPDKRYRRVETPIKSPECKKLEDASKNAFEKIRTDKEKHFVEQEKNLKNAVFAEIYNEIFKHGLDFMKRVQVVFVREFKDKKLYGYWLSEKHKIYAKTHSEKGVPLSEDIIYGVLVHEFMHAYSDSFKWAVEQARKKFTFDKQLFPEDKKYDLDIRSYDLYKQTIPQEYDYGSDQLGMPEKEGEESYKEYAYSSSESYARGASPALRLNINKLKGKTGQSLNDDIRPEDIFDACGRGLEIALTNKSLDDRNSIEDDALEFVYRRTVACRSYIDEFREYVKSIAGNEQSKTTKDINLKDQLPAVIKHLKKKYETDEAFRQKFYIVSRQINQIAKSDTANQQSAIAEMRDIRKLFKRFLSN